MEVGARLDRSASASGVERRWWSTAWGGGVASIWPESGRWPENDRGSLAAIPATVEVVRGTDFFVSARGVDLGGQIRRRGLAGAEKWVKRSRRRVRSDRERILAGGQRGSAEAGSRSGSVAGHEAVAMAVVRWPEGCRSLASGSLKWRWRRLEKCLKIMAKIPKNMVGQC